MADSSHPLRRYRENKGLTLAKLAARFRTTRSWLSRIERGEAPGNGLLKRIVRACDGEVTADDLLRIKPRAG